MTKRALWRCIASLMLTAYLVLAVCHSRNVRLGQPFPAVEILINDSLNTGFIDRAYINNLVAGVCGNIDTTKAGRISTLQLQNTLQGDQRIENARCMVLNNGTLRINVAPMVPVARVLPEGSCGYYVNAKGKQIPADASHHIDVPVVTGNISGAKAVEPLLPMLAYLHANPQTDAWASAINLLPDGDIEIIPAVLGHTVTIGDTSAIADKIQRLRQFYAEVMPVKGWDYYDNISVKWRGRVVATKRHKTNNTAVPLTEIDADDETLPAETMLSWPTDSPTPQTNPSDPNP